MNKTTGMNDDDFTDTSSPEFKQTIGMNDDDFTDTNSPDVKRKIEEAVYAIEKKYKAQLKEKDDQLAKKDDQLKEKDDLIEARFKAQLKEKADQLKEKDDQLKEKDDQLKEKDDLIEARSLQAVIFGKGIKEIVCRGSSFAHLNPSNYNAATVVKKKFNYNVNDLMSVVESLIHDTGNDPEFKKLCSRLMPLMQEEEPFYFVEADVASYANLGLGDAVSTINEIMNIVAPHKKVKLFVRQEMSIFSNRCDHAVVCDITTNTPIFCVETKKHFDETVREMEKSKSFGQCFDQLRAMQALGYAFPLGALTCFNETYMTSLNDEIVWDALPTLESLQDTINKLYGMESPTNGTPPPLHVERVAAQVSDSTLSRFVADAGRRIVRSEDCINQNNLICAFVIIILNALSGFKARKPLQTFTDGQRIAVDCLEMSTRKLYWTKKSYQWGKLYATYKGPLKEQMFALPNMTFYLIDCIGSGSTSKAYYAVTINGYDCVVKIYVQSHDERGQLKDPATFKKDAQKFVREEKENFTKVYGDELRGYVHERVLNGFSCVILPFFEPLRIDRRSNEMVQGAIQERLKLFASKKMAFRECDRKWRHIGAFNGKIYLFHLAELKHCETEDEAEMIARDHYNRLMGKLV